MPAHPLLAVFVGGKSRRMGTPKGLLGVPGTGLPILERLVSLGREAGLWVVLVGDATPYATLAKDVPRIADDPPGAGPLAGLHAVLRYAVQIQAAHVIAVACDMPFVSVEALTELANHPSGAAVVAPRRTPEDPWEPMLARYDASALVDVARAAIGRGDRAFQQLFASLEVESLHLSPAVERALRDWDTPEDIGA
jgi:molybdopterin-guanine dinucleotide biosynthesis protein A